MPEVHAAETPRIAQIDALLRDLSSLRDPNGVFLTFSRRFAPARDIDYFVAASVRNMAAGRYKITRQHAPKDLDGEPEDRREANNPWHKWNQLPAFEGGLIGNLIAEGRPRLLRDIDLSNDPALHHLAGPAVDAPMRCAIAAPLYDAGKPLNWALNFSTRRDGFSIDDLEQLVLTGNLFGALTRNLLAVQREESLNTRLRSQMEEIAGIQRSLLPSRVPSIPGVRTATSYLPSEQAGGDYYDWVHLGADRWGVIIADVAGHGAPAATVMAMLHAILGGYNDSDESPSAVSRYLNERLVAAQMENIFVTAFLAMYDARSGDLSYTRAGHNPPRLLRAATGTVEAIYDGATLPLGVIPDPPPAQASLRLQPGDMLLLYTDGITEAFDRDGEMFGVEGLDQALIAGAESPDDAIDAVHSHLYAFTKARTRKDDQTLVAMRFDAPGVCAAYRK